MHKDDTIKAMKALLSMTEIELQTLESDDTAPAYLRIIARDLCSENGFTALEKLLDRIFGKSSQKQEIEHSGKIAMPTWLSGEIV